MLNFAIKKESKPKLQTCRIANLTHGDLFVLKSAYEEDGLDPEAVIVYMVLRRDEDTQHEYNAVEMNYNAMLCSIHYTAELVQVELTVNEIKLK